jgi:hypothetical protein
VDGWARGGLITSFNMYFPHVKLFTSKINEEGEGLREFLLCFLILVMDSDVEKG